MARLRTWVAVAVVAGVVATVLTFAVLYGRRAQGLVDTGRTRRSVEASLARLLPPAAASARDERLLKAAQDLRREPYVSAVWLVDRRGEITYHLGGPGKQGDNVREAVAGDMGRVLAAMPAGQLTRSQELQLLAVAAMRREGDHNDVFRHMVRSVESPDGEPIAFVALSYDVNPSAGAPPSIGTVLVLAAAVAGFVTFWLGLPLWVYLDGRDRGEAAALWSGFVLLTNLVGLVGYLIAISKPRLDRG